MFDSDKRQASRSRRMARRMDSSTIIGSHVDRSDFSGTRRPPRHASQQPYGAPDGSLDFGDPRRSQRANRGYVDYVQPETSSYESDDAYARRVSRRGYAEEIQHRKRVRFTLFAVVVASLALVAAVVVGLATFFISSDTRLSFSSSNASEALVKPEAGQPYFILCAAELGTSTAPPGPENTAYLAVRIDEGQRQLSFVSIPHNTTVAREDGTSCMLYQAGEWDGDAGIVRGVSGILDADIAHFVRTDADRLSAMVDLLGGVPVSITEAVDDPNAGIVTIKAGEQVLDGKAALVFLRAINLSGGMVAQADNRVVFSVNLAASAISGEKMSFTSYVSDLGTYIETDWPSSEILATGDALNPLQDATIYSTLLPGHYMEADGITSYEIDKDRWEGLLANIKEGKAPDELDVAVSAVVPAQVTVEVRNGCGVNGAAAQMASVLEAKGYTVTDVGNAEDAVYPETLVIYHGEENEPAAQAILRDIVGNRVVNGGDFYTFDSDVLVIVGSDWVPIT